MRNAPYINPSHDSILVLYRTFPNMALSVASVIMLFGFTYIVWSDFGPVTYVAIHSRAVVYCFVLQYFVSFLVLQSSRWGRES